MAETRQKKRFSGLWIFAAILALVLGIGALLIQGQSEKPVPISAITSGVPKPGEKIKFSQEMLMLNMKRAMDEQFTGRGRQLQTAGIYLDLTRE